MSLATYRSSKVGAETFRWFFEVPTDTTTWATKAYHMGLILADSNAEDTGESTDDIADVTSKVSGKTITHDDPMITSSHPYLVGEPVSEFEKYIAEHMSDDATRTVNVLKVDLNDGDATAGYAAVKRVALPAVTQAPGGDAQGNATVECEYHFISEPVFGTATFDAETGIATFTPKA